MGLDHQNQTLINNLVNTTIQYDDEVVLNLDTQGNDENFIEVRAATISDGAQENTQNSDLADRMYLKSSPAMNI